MNKNRIPKFKSIEDERLFWDTHSITDFDELEEVHNVQFPQPKHIVIDLKPQQFKTLNLLAIKNKVSYRRLIQKWISQKLSDERIALSH